MPRQWKKFRHSKHGGVTNVEIRPDGKPEAHARRRGWIPLYENDTPEQPEQSGESAPADEEERSESAADTTNEES